MKHLSMMLLTAFVLSIPAAFSHEIDLKPFWDDETPLENPHKGWYHHFPDNHINKYKIARDEDVLQIPGMDHIYIRLAWAYLEPQEGQFNWQIIDKIIEKWRAHGLGIAFRISCKETSTDRIEQQFATPKWEMEEGAKGGYYRNGEETGQGGPWEPVFDDPVFLEKLETFLRAFAERYDGKSWVRYIDVGSVGDWGEGHTYSGSRKYYGFEARKKHIDLYLKYFKQTQLVVSDDFVYAISEEDGRRKFHEYVVQNGLSYRDDSILVDWYVKTYPKTFTMRSPEFFADVWQTKPTVLELEHYSAVKRNGNWNPTPGSSLATAAPGKHGSDLLRGALETMHATYIGYHGYADEWYKENPELTAELLNRCGYWYFPHSIEIPDTLKVGETHTIKIVWENRGVAPAYEPFHLKIRLEGSKTLEFEQEARNQNWMPVNNETTYEEDYNITIPNVVPAGEYRIKFKLFSHQAERDVFLALDRMLLGKDNYYNISTVHVEN